MSTLKERIQQDLTQAMRDKNEDKVSTLRLLKSAIMKWEVEGIRREASDEVIVGILMKEAKQRQDSIEQYRKGRREDLAQKEEREMQILKEYLPKELSDDELREVISETILQMNVKSPQDFGKVMSALMPKVKGRADGAKVSAMVKELLGS
ncbi:GatB/YqeY domain-containing protein [Candidatus Peregrinibacteria bacterium]|nr:GatB/YqeY domain-containing protein [Candidatus Peregrinibacteria bacterium]